MKFEYLVEILRDKLLFKMRDVNYQVRVTIFLSYWKYCYLYYTCNFLEGCQLDYPIYRDVLRPFMTSLYWRLRPGISSSEASTSALVIGGSTIWYFNTSYLQCHFALKKAIVFCGLPNLDSLSGLCFFRAFSLKLQ